jgi:polyhydroxyalkanoate depolymerase
MLYQAYQLQDDLVAPWRMLARSLMLNAGPSFWNLGEGVGRRFAAALEMISRFELTHVRPDFAIDTVRVGNRDVPVTIETALELPFGKLLHFAKDVDTPQPRVLVVAPLSGHFSTLLAGTVKTLLAHHYV